MKKIRVLLVLGSAFFLFGCGSGGGTTSSSTSSGTPGGSPAPTSTFTLNIVEGTPQTAKALAVTHAAAVTVAPVANKVRVIFRLYSTHTQTVPVFDDNGNPTGATETITSRTEDYKYVNDVPYSSSISVGVPASTGYPNGYHIDVLTNLDDGAGNHIMLKYGSVDGVSIPGSSSATVTITDFTNPSTVNIQNPAIVNSQSNYSLPVIVGMPLRNYYKMRQDFSTTSAPIFATYSSKNVSAGSTLTFTAPTSYVAGNVYFQGQFFIDDSMLDATKHEQWLKWTRVYPNPSYGESLSTTLNFLYGVTIPGL